MQMIALVMVLEVLKNIPFFSDRTLGRTHVNSIANATIVCKYTFDPQERY